MVPGGIWRAGGDGCGAPAALPGDELVVCGLGKGEEEAPSLAEQAMQREGAKRRAGDLPEDAHAKSSRRALENPAQGERLACDSAKRWGHEGDSGAGRSAYAHSGISPSDALEGPADQHKGNHEGESPPWHAPSRQGDGRQHDKSVAGGVAAGKGATDWGGEEGRGDKHGGILEREVSVETAERRGEADGRECSGPPREGEPQGDLNEDVKDEMMRPELRGEGPAMAIGLAAVVAEQDRTPGAGLPEEQLMDKDMSVHEVMQKGLDAQVPVQLQAMPSPLLNEKKENGSVEQKLQKLMELPHGLPKLDEIHEADRPRHAQTHEAHQALTLQYMQGAPKPPPASAWGAPVGGGPSFASMLASTNTFAAMLQTGLAPPANQQPISVKLAGSNAFSAVLAAGTFSSVLAQGQDGKDKLRAAGDKEDGLPDKKGNFILRQSLSWRLRMLALSLSRSHARPLLLVAAVSAGLATVCARAESA